jgi:hypothetical protein
MKKNNIKKDKNDEEIYILYTKEILELFNINYSNLDFNNALKSLQKLNNDFNKSLTSGDMVPSSTRYDISYILNKILELIENKENPKNIEPWLKKLKANYYYDDFD